MKDIYKYIGTGLVGAMLLGAGAVGGAYVKDPITKIETITIEKEVSVEVEVPRDLTQEEKDVFVENFLKEKGTSMDDIEFVIANSDNLKEVLQHIYDKEGKVEYLTTGLDEDQIMEIANRIDFSNKVLSIAEQKTKEKFADEIDNRKFTIGGVVVDFDEDDIEKVKIKSDNVKIKEGEIDFEDGDAIVTLLVKFEHNDVEYVADVEAEFDDGEFDEINIKEVRLRG